MGFIDRLLGRAAKPVPLERTVPTATAKPGQGRFAVLDVETTGLSADQHRIVEIAVVTTDPWGRVLDEWGSRINPQGPIGATHVHGITEADVRDAPLFADVITQLNERLAGAAVAAHHAKFDLAFLRAEYRRAGWGLPRVPALCTLEASEYHLPTLDRRRLADCCWAVGAQLTDAHSALGDARATATLLAAFMNPEIGHPPLPQHTSLPSAALGIPWPTAPTRAPQPVSSTYNTPSRQAPPARVQAALAAKTATGPVPSLVQLVERFSLIDALDEGAPAGAVAYLEKLAEVLEDGEVTDSEAADLVAVAEAAQLAKEDVTAANRAFVLALAHAALEDGKVTRAERSELQAISDVLGVSQGVIPALVERAELARLARMSTGLGELPANWPHGDPLRVGDKVVFTGCEDTLRNRLEAQSEALGVRIVSGVSAKTAMLVTDGTFNGAKAAKAQELCTRVVHPDTYAVLLAHLQPARMRVARAIPKPQQAAPKGAPATGVAMIPSATAPSPNPALVRAWARENGHEVGARGRLHKDLIDAYLRDN